MKLSKTKTTAIVITLLLAFSLTASIMLMPTTNAHTPPWQIPTYAFVVAEPNPVGVGQTINIYMWLDEIYGSAGATSVVAGSGQTGANITQAYLSNDYRFIDYQLTITPPTGSPTTTLFPVISDPDSAQETTFTPQMTGTYMLNFTYLGQTYGANGDGNPSASIFGDQYLPSTATTNLTVQSTPISFTTPITPLPTSFWTTPIYGENSNWYTISSNWLGTGSGVESTAGYNTLTGFTANAAIERFPGDAVGSQTSHIMWTTPLQFGGVVGGNDYATPGVNYFEGSAYNQRFTNPIIMNGYLYYTAPVSFTAPNSGPLVCINIATGQVLWSSNTIPPLSFGYIYNLYDPDQHGTFPPMLVASVGGGLTGIPSMLEFFDAYTGDSMFNVTNVPGVAPQTGQTINGQAAQALTTATTMGPNGEQIRYVFMNVGTSQAPNWYLAQWNSSKLWQYDINPYTFAGSTSPSIVNASTGALITAVPVPLTGTTGTLPNGASTFVPYGSALTVNGNIGIPAGSTTYTAAAGNTSLATYDWNVSVPWLNTMPLQQTYNAANGAYTTPVMQGTVNGVFAAGGTNPVTILAAFTNNLMLCVNGSLPTGFAATGAGFPQLPYTLFAVNLNASRGQIGSIMWMQNYNPPPGNLTVKFAGADPVNNVFVLSYDETLQLYGFNLLTGNLLWGPTPAQTGFDYYGAPYFDWLPCQIAYGNIYDSSFSGICYCYNDLTGKVEWTYGNGGPGNSTSTIQTPYGDYPTFINAVGNGIVYLVSTEHTATDPIYKGAMARAINATTGQEIWTLSAYTGEFSAMSYAIADGYSIFANGYDNQIYSVGQGPSSTTVSASPSVSTLGNNVVISGTVTDVSAGTRQAQVAADFPHGVPCASDASMTAWMGYVYQQQPEPTNFTGVPVAISVTDSNGNTRVIGTATTDESGSYSLTWTPNIYGNYTVSASFLGTNGYWPSNAEASFNIMTPSATTTSAPTSTPTSVADMYFVPAIAGLFVLIIVVAIVLALLMLRKKA